MHPEELVAETNVAQLAHVHYCMQDWWKEESQGSFRRLSGRLRAPYASLVCMYVARGKPSLVR